MVTSGRVNRRDTGFWRTDLRAAARPGHFDTRSVQQWVAASWAYETKTVCVPGRWEEYNRAFDSRFTTSKDTIKALIGKVEIAAAGQVNNVKIIISEVRLEFAAMGTRIDDLGTAARVGGRPDGKYGGNKYFDRRSMTLANFGGQDKEDLDKWKDPFLH